MSEITAAVIAHMRAHPERWMHIGSSEFACDFNPLVISVYVGSLPTINGAYVPRESWEQLNAAVKFVIDHHKAEGLNAMRAALGIKEGGK